MQNRTPPQLDMTPEGMFREPLRPPLASRIGVIALMVAVFAGMVGAAALAFWFALALIPVAVVAAVVAWVAFRIQMWRSRRSGRLARGIHPR